MAEPAPLPWRVDARASERGGQVYVVDGNGRKIAVVFGKTGEKVATADLIVASVNGHG